MKDFQNFLDTVLPKASEEDMVIAIGILIKDANEDAKQEAKEDPLNQMEKEIYMKLQEDAFDSGLIGELSYFILKNPRVDMVTLDSWFRNEWDI